MRKLTLFFTMSILLILAACGSDEAAGNNGEEKEKIAVTTTFLYDMVNVLEDGVDGFDTELIIPAGEDPHVYEPTASDLQTLSEADVILYQGLHFEGRMGDVLENGVAAAEDFSDYDLEEMKEEGEVEVDPHFWFNIDLYKQAMENVSDTLIEHNPDGEEQYTENLNEYFEELDELDQYVTERVNEIPEESRIVITPHDAFGYLAESYDLEVHAPQGFSTDSEVSNNQIQATADMIVENNINAIFVETTTNPDRMTRLQEVVESDGGEVEVVGLDDEALFSDSLAPVGEEGDTYIDMFRHNIDTISDHLQ